MTDQNDAAGEPDDAHGYPPTRLQRRIRWIRPDLQRKVILGTLFVAVLVLLLNFQLTLIGYWLFLNDGQFEAEHVLGDVPVILVKYFLISLGLAIPLSFSVGVYYSFKFCGPIYRFKQYFDSLIKGGWNSRCGLRKGDDLQDVKDAINDVIGEMTTAVRDRHRLIARLRRTLEDLPPGTVDRGVAVGLLAEIEKEAATFERRFPGGDEEETRTKEEETAPASA